MKKTRKVWGFVGLGSVVTSIIGYVAIKKQLGWLKLQKEIDSIPYEIADKKKRRASWTTRYRGPWF